MKFVSFEKRSKKEQKKANAERRKTWEHSPLTKIVASKKKYNRRKFKKGGNDDTSFFLYIITIRKKNALF